MKKIALVLTFIIIVSFTFSCARHDTESESGERTFIEYDSDGTGAVIPYYEEDLNKDYKLNTVIDFSFMKGEYSVSDAKRLSLPMANYEIKNKKEAFEKFVSDSGEKKFTAIYNDPDNPRASESSEIITFYLSVNGKENQIKITRADDGVYVSASRGIQFDPRFHNGRISFFTEDFSVYDGLKSICEF